MTQRLPNQNPVIIQTIIWQFFKLPTKSGYYTNNNMAISLKLFVFWYQSLWLFIGNIYQFNNTLLQAVHPSRPLLKKSLMVRSPGNLQTIVTYFPALWSDTQCH